MEVKPLSLIEQVLIEDPKNIGILFYFENLLEESIRLTGGS